MQVRSNVRKFRYSERRRMGALLPLVVFLLGSGTVLSQEIALIWDSNDEPDLFGYKVYYGQASRRYEGCIDVGMVTEHPITDLVNAEMVYFAVTAYDMTGNESGYSVEVSTIESFGQNFSLMPNYPNPFNPETVIPYFLPKRATITLAIYDLLGRMVKLLEQGPKEAGRYEVSWTGTDESGLSVANGIYFCRLTVGHLCQTRKLILIR